MIQVLFELDGDVAVEVYHQAVTGARIHWRGRAFQFLEGPEAAVMLALAVLKDDVAHLARTRATSRSFSEWQTEFVPLDSLPEHLAKQVRAFALVSEPRVEAREAIGFLTDLADRQPSSTIASGRRLMTKVGGRSGNRSWMAV